MSSIIKYRHFHIFCVILYLSLLIWDTKDNIFSTTITLSYLYYFSLYCPDKKAIIYWIDSKMFYVYLGLKILICDLINNYFHVMNNVAEKLDNNNKNNYFYYLFRKILSILFITLATLPLFYPIFTFSWILIGISNIDFAEFLSGYIVLMDSGNSGSGPSENFGGGPSGGGNFGGGGNSGKNCPVFLDLKEKTNESKRPQGEFPCVPPTEAYMNMLKNTVSPHHFSLIYKLYQNHPNAEISDWSAFRLFDRNMEKEKTGFYYIDSAPIYNPKKDYIIGSYHQNDIIVFRWGNKYKNFEGILLGRQPLPDTKGIFYNANANTAEAPNYKQYDPKMSQEQIGIRAIYVKENNKYILTGMHTSTASKKIIRE